MAWLGILFLRLYAWNRTHVSGVAHSERTHFQLTLQIEPPPLPYFLLKNASEADYTQKNAIRV